MTNLNWAQIVLLILMILNLLTSAYLDGRVKKSNKWSFSETLVFEIILLTLLYFGGFFK